MVAPPAQKPSGSATLRHLALGNALYDATPAQRRGASLPRCFRPCRGGVSLPREPVAALALHHLRWWRSLATGYPLLAPPAQERSGAATLGISAQQRLPGNGMGWGVVRRTSATMGRLR